MDATFRKHLQMSDGREANESLVGSFSRLSDDGRSWFAAEAALAKAQFASDGKRLAMIAGLAVLVLATVCAGLMLLLLYLVALLAPHVGGLANAAGLLGLLLLVIAALSVWGLMQTVKTQMGIAALLKRWSGILSHGPRSK